MKRNLMMVLSVACLSLLSAGYSDVRTTSEYGAADVSEEVAAIEVSGEKKLVARPEGWTEETHGSAAAPNYGLVFPRNRVGQITIVISLHHWEAMQAELPELLAPSDERPDGLALPRNPMWVPATVEFEGNRWTNVGVRYKGLSSLRNTWRDGWTKLPFKLDFAQFEKEHPETKNQRFHGFKQLSLANNYGDNSHLRDTLAYDLLRDAGLVAAETAHYEVLVDHGEGGVRLGLYTMIEVVDDTVIKRYFGNDRGNIYEGDGQAATLAEGTFHQIRDHFLKENNRKKADWGDIEALYWVLHSEQRSADPAAWRANLESIFDVDTFLKWLALSAVMNHWDSYGALPHNYYLYNNPGTGLLTWISWDHNLILVQQPKASLDKEDLDDSWPLIRYLIDDPAYRAAYVTYIEHTASELFVPDRVAAMYQETVSMIEPHAALGTSREQFLEAVDSLFRAAGDRAAEVNHFLVTQRAASDSETAPN